MGPKKGNPIADENYWRTSIEEAPLDEETWQVKVILIEAAGSEQDRIYLNKFEAYAAEERRFVIKNICRTETIFMVNQLGGEKKVKDDSLRVFEEGQAYLKDKKDIPPEILALIIKHQILKMKGEYLFIRQQRLEVKEGMERESTTMIHKAEIKGTVNVKLPESPAVIEPAPKGKKGKAEPLSKQFEIDENKKYNTLLRVRGEEWRDKVYIDDYPVDGPNLYVAVTGFIESHLPGWLVKIGIPLTAIVQIRIDITTTTIPSTLIRATKRGQSQTDMIAEKSLKFWEELQQLRINKYSANDFKNTAFVVFSPPYWNDHNLSFNPEKIYDEVCFLMYDIQDLNRQHIHYLQSLKIINIPEEYKDNGYVNVYENHINGIPLESVTSYLILNSILQAISECQNYEERSSMSSLSTAVTFNQITENANLNVDKLYQSETLVKQFIDELCLIDSHKKIYRSSYGNEFESHKNPIVINYGDFCKYNTFHLGNINLDNIVMKMLSGMPINKLWLSNKRPTGKIDAKINFHINVLLSCFDRNDVETAELTRLLHILACRKLYNNRSSLKKEHLCPSTISEFKKTYLKRSVLAEPLSNTCINKCTSTTSPSFPSILKNMNASDKSSFEEDDEACQIKLLFDFPDISELVSAAEIADEKPINHMIDDFEYFEDFSDTRAFQIILDAFNKFNCVDYKYCEVTDCFILMFFNSHDKDGIAREEWRCHVPTPLCLQDFFDFVLEEHYDWIRDEEKIYDENIRLRSQSNCKDSKGPQTINNCVEDTDVEIELLMEGSLKYEEITNLDAFNNETTDSKVVFSKKTGSLISVADAESKSTKKSKSPANVTPKFVDSGLEASKEMLSGKPFSGYNLGDRRVEVFGKDSSYFSKDGSRISSFYSLLIPMNLEYVILNIVSGNGQNEFWMHKAIGESVKPEIIDTCESFRIKTKDNLTMYIKKQVYQVPIPLARTSLGNVKYRESTAKSPSPDISNILPQIFESRSYHSLFVTWPNGLITESVYENNSPNISHIKQFYITPQSHIDEEIRCINLNGEVIIFKYNGNIEILQPSSSCIKITKCEKRITSDEILEEIQSTTSSQKSKKGKEKGKRNDKPNKTSSKSSKNALIEDEKEDSQKPLQYKLFIEEYETIEMNGLRRKWINDNYFVIEKLLIKSATDFCQGEIFSKRMDGTTILVNKDGIQLVTFPNKTRIITKFMIEEEEIFPEWTDEEIEYFSMFPFENDAEVIKSKGSMSQKIFTAPNTYSNSQTSLESGKMKLEHVSKKAQKTDGYISIQVIFIIEHPNFTTITVDKSNDKITVESPNNTSVTFDHDNNYQFILDDRTSAKFDGANLNVIYEACSKCRSLTTCDVKIKSEEISSVTQIHRSWLKMNDSFCKKIVVNEEGNISVVNETSSVPKFHSKESLRSEEIINCSDQYDNENKIESSTTSHVKCGQMYEAKSLKFFILKRDLTCAELVHRDIIEQYKQTCRWPWCSVHQYDTFGDQRTLWSILTPINLNEAERWLMDSKFSKKPKYLVYKDLKKDSGKGFYHWMRPYKRFHPKPIKPDNVLSERLPRAFILRTLEQQWKEEGKDELKGAKELLKAIFRYRHIMESDSQSILHVPIHDPRSEHEQKTDDIVQAIAHRVYEDLKARLAVDVQNRARQNITTRPPPPPPEDVSFEGELDEDTTDGLIFFEEDRASVMKEIESSAEMSPTLKRYWRRRAEEFKEEQFYKYLLREGSVPPYFRNVLGGAIWWEIDKAADDAVTSAERRKMKCVCDEDQDSDR